MGKATSMHTTWKTKSLTCSACRTNSKTVDTINRRAKASRNGFVSGWKRLGQSGNPQRKNEVGFRHGETEAQRQRQLIGIPISQTLSQTILRFALGALCLCGESYRNRTRCSF